MTRINRRAFIQSALASGTAISAGLSSRTLAARTPGHETRSANEKLRIAVIGVAARGEANLNGVAHEDIVALCDIDAARLQAAATRFPNAKTTDDFREAIDHPDIDAVVVSTPDHMHAMPVVRALKRKLPVYCEKPLTHSIHEARTIVELVQASDAVTQMGNQIHSGGNYRRVVEAVQAGVIGPVKRVHVWVGGGVRQGVRVDAAEVPQGINYDMWLGPAPYRPYHPTHFHFNWRYWWDFGSGHLGDFVCHYMDLPFWALNLKYPTEIQAKGEKGHDGDNDCPQRLQVDYRFPAQGDQPGVHVTWYHGGWMPEGAEQYKKNSAVLFEGEEGRILADYSTRKIFMDGDRAARPVEPSIPDSVGHHLEWLNAIRGEGHADSPFTYGALLTECGHLGNLSYRLGGKPINWDAEAMRAVDCPEADVIIKRPYRDGWSLDES